MKLKISSYAILVFIGLSLFSILATSLNTPLDKLSKIETFKDFQPLKVADPLETLNPAPSPIKTQKVSKIVQLEASNTVELMGPITNETIGRVMQRLLQVSRVLPAKTPIYLVINSPGGSVFDGLDLIDLADALPQRIETITLFAASIAFQTVQALGNRMILRQGTLMSHRGKGSVSGQFSGELETRYRMVKRKLDYLDTMASKRMGLSIEEYSRLVKDEYWVHGFDAVAEHAADEEILARCGDSLTGTRIESLNTIFGEVRIEFSKCPLIKTPLEIKLDKIAPQNLAFVKAALDSLYYHPRKYVENFILTGKHDELFRK